MKRPSVTISPTNTEEWKFFLSFEYDAYQFENGALVLTGAVGMTGVNRTYGWNPAEPKTIMIPLHAIQYAEFES